MTSVVGAGVRVGVRNGEGIGVGEGSSVGVSEASGEGVAATVEVAVGFRVGELAGEGIMVSIGRTDGFGPGDGTGEEVGTGEVSEVESVEGSRGGVTLGIALIVGEESGEDDTGVLLRSVFLKL